MGTRTQIYVNEFDTSGHGLIVERVDGWVDGLVALDRVSQLPGRVGGVILPPESETAPRTIQVVGTMLGQSAQGGTMSLATLRSNLDQLKERLYRGTVEVRFVDQTDRYVNARCSGFQVPATAPQFQNPKSRVSFSLFCPDPLIYSTQPYVVGFSTVKASLPLGTAPVAPIIRIMGAATNPVLTYRNNGGVSKQTMGFTVTLAATDYLEIDCELATITKYASGVSSNGMSLWTSGDFITLDPQHGDYVNSLWPSLETSAGTGETAYRRAWL